MNPFKTVCLLVITCLFIVSCDIVIPDSGITQIESIAEEDSLEVDSIPELFDLEDDERSIESQLLTEVSEQINNDSLIQAEQKLQFIRENILDLDSLQNIIWARYKAAYCLLYIKNGNYALAAINGKSSIEIYSNCEETLSTNNLLIKAYQNYSVALYWLGRYTDSKIVHYSALNVARNNKLKDSELVLHSNLASILLELGEFETALTHLDTAQILAENADDKKHLGEVFNIKAVIYETVDNLAKGQEYHLKALELRKLFYDEESTIIARSYNNLGVNFMYQGFFTKAIEYLNKAAAIFEITLPSGHYFKSIPPQNIAYCHHMLGDYQKEIFYCKRAIAIKEGKTDELNQEYIKLYCILMDAYIGLNDFTQAENYAQKCAFIISNNSKVLPNLISAYYDGIADMKIAKRDYRGAINDLLSAHEYGEGTVSSISHKYNLAQLYIDIGENENAEHLINEIDLDISNGYVFDERDGIYLAAMIAQKKYLLLQSYLEEHNKDVLSQIEQINQKQNEYLDQFQSYHTRIDGFRMYKILSIISELDLKLASRLNKLSFTESAFNKIERMFGYNLRASIRDDFAVNFSSIPDSILSKEYELRIKLSALHKQRFIGESNETATDSISKIYSSNIFDLRRGHDLIIKDIEENYPDFHRLRFEKTTISIKGVQDSLITKNQALIEYFVGDSSIFTFTILKDTFYVNEIKKDFPLDSLVNNMLKGIYEPFTAGKEHQQGAREYTNAAHLIYQKVFAPVDALLPENTELIIVPDGILGYIPFDALLVEAPNKVDNFRNHHYLLKDHQISYAYSATLLKEMKYRKHRREPSKNTLAFAPSFNQGNSSGDTAYLASRYIDVSDNRNWLSPLKYNDDEVNKIDSIIGADVYLDSLATKDRFTSIAGDYRILHLSTHGKANDKVGDYSFLAFYEQNDSLNNDWLYNRELYNLQLNADMVVLSACETGIGELQRGEGIISLARGFSYAGAKSIVTTLWSVNDKSSMQLMENFYSHLKTGKTKDAALRQAKLDYLENNASMGLEPFFWAGVIPIGDMSPVELDSRMPWMYWGVGIMLLLLVTWFIRKRKYS